MVEELDESSTVATSGRGGWEASVVVAGPDINGFPVATRLWMRSATAVASCWTVAPDNKGATAGGPATGAGGGTTATSGTSRSSGELEDEELMALNYERRGERNAATTLTGCLLQMCQTTP